MLFVFFQCLDFILQGLDRPFKSPQVRKHISFFPNVNFCPFLSGGPCCSAASAAEMARQTAAATPAATGPGLLAARGHGLWWTGGEDCEIVKWKNGCAEDEKYMHLILMQNAPALCKFWLTGQEVGMLLLRSIYFDFLNRLHWNKRCRIEQGSCELHEENALPTINLIQKSFNIFRRVISPMCPMHDFTLPDATGRTSHLFRCRRMRRAGGFASCMWKRHGAVAKARPATRSSRRCSRRRRQRALRRRKKQRKKTQDWCHANIPNGESCTYLTHDYFTLNHESIPEGLAAPHQAATQLEAVQRLKGFNFHQFPNFVKLIRFRNSKRGANATGPRSSWQPSPKSWSQVFRFVLI